MLAHWALLDFLQATCMPAIAHPMIAANSMAIPKNLRIGPAGCLDLYLGGCGVGGGNRCLPLAAGAVHTRSRVVVPHACIRGGMWNYITHSLSICMDTCALPKLTPRTIHDYMQHGIMRDL